MEGLSGVAGGRGHVVSGSCEKRDGVALVAVVLLMLALTGLAHGLLTLARFEHAAARAGGRELQVRVAAEAAVAELLASESAPERGTVAIWAPADATGGGMAGTSYSADLIRLSREMWLAQGSAFGGSLGPLRTARAVWALDPVERVARSDGVLVYGATAPVTVSGSIDGSSVVDVPEVLPPGGCGAWAAALDSVFPSGSLSALAVAEDSVVAGLGRLTLDSLLARLPARVAGLGSPAPADRAGVCLVDEPWNWGDPGRPWRPCGDHMVRIVSEGDLTVERGIGQGLLIVAGELTLIDAEFNGMIVTAGRLVLLGAARLRGLARAAGGVDIGPSAAVDGSACWAAAALSAQTLTRPAPLPASGWIGPF